MSRIQPRIHVYRENPPGAALTIEHVLPSGRTIERALGPRGLLDLDEAAAVLGRSRGQVVSAIRARFLRARRRGRQLYVPVQACTDFLREELADIKVQERTLARIRAGRERVIPWEIARRRL